MGLVDTEEIMNISLWVWAANQHILCSKCSYVCLVNNAHGKIRFHHIWTGKASTIGSTVVQS